MDKLYLLKVYKNNLYYKGMRKGEAQVTKDPRKAKAYKTLKGATGAVLALRDANDRRKWFIINIHHYKEAERWYK